MLSPLLFYFVEPNYLFKRLSFFLFSRSFLIVPHGQHRDNFVFARNLEKLAGPAYIEPADPACAKTEFFRLKDNMFSGYSDIQQIELDVLDLFSNPVGNDIQTG